MHLFLIVFGNRQSIYDELKKAYEKIQSHDKMQKEFIDIAAHELTVM